MAAPRQRTGLGRGLGDLIRPTGPVGQDQSATESSQRSAETPASPKYGYAPEGAYFAELPVGEIRPNPKQPRQVFDEDELDELVESIREVGLLQPIVVTPLEAPDQGIRFELVMGERRLRASKQAGLDTIPAIVRPTEAHDMLRDALLENLHRAQLNPLEEAAAYQQMLDDFDCTQEELAQRIKRSRPQISNTLRLLKLPGTIQRRVAAGVLSAGHARALLMLDDPVLQEQLAQRIVAEGLSVRATEEIATLSRGEKATRRRRIPQAPSPRAEALSEVFSDAFDTRVNVQLGKHKGRITIEFAAEEDLDRILNIFREGIDTSIDH